MKDAVEYFQLERIDRDWFIVKTVLHYTKLNSIDLHAKWIFIIIFSLNDGVCVYACCTKKNVKVKFILRIWIDYNLNVPINTNCVLVDVAAAADAEFWISIWNLAPKILKFALKC